MAKNINSKPFDETTKLKLSIFRECFREWFPVFIYDKWTDEVYIFDFFAGSGMDSNGTFGSPLVLLDEAKGDDRKLCGNNKKEISFVFNESMKRKSEELRENVSAHISECEQLNNCGGCIYEKEVVKSEFKSIFTEAKIKSILESKKIGKFILLDQYGFSQIDDEIFANLIEYPKTDFIFFISSSFIRRFQEHPNVKAYIDTEKINFDETKPKECHRIIADYFRNSIPKSKEYYLHHFSIQKEVGKGNYYGLIFGSNHTLGMEKFLKVCWQKDKFSGEANFNINNDYEAGTLFFNTEESNKKEKVKSHLVSLVLNKKITNNIDGLKFTIKQGCEPKLFTEVIKDLERSKQITRSGSLNYSSTSIHKIKKYNIVVQNHT
jgi:three-Cys-motif partner protein